MCATIIARRSWIGAVATLMLSLGALPAAAQLHAIPPGKALIYLLQGDTGRFTSLPVTANGRPVGSVRADTYLLLSTGPGKVLIGVTATVAAATRIEIEAGKAYFISEAVNAAGIPVFRVLPPSVGQQQLARYTPAPRGVTGTRPTPAAPTAAAPKPAPSKPKAKAPAPAEPAPPPKKPEPSRAVARDSGSIFLIKAGAFSLTQDAQDWNGLDTDVDASASSVFALEYDYLFPSQWSLGAELVSYKNSWSQAGPDGSFTTAALTVNGKRYFAVNQMVRPFVGIGVGSVGTDFSGDITGNTRGAAYQLMAGAEFRFNNIGAHVELKSLSAKTEGEDDSGGTTKVDASGQGLFAGLSIHF